MKLLALDTATEQCSVALLDGDALLAREARPGTAHSARVLDLIDVLLAEAGMNLRDLDAIAFGRGPGAFTGVRLAASVTQGLAFGAGLPVLPVSDLRAVAQQVFELPDAPAFVLVCQDARMGEVYCASFERRDGFASSSGAERVARPATLRMDLPAGAVSQAWGVGSGFRAFPELGSRAGVTIARVLPDCLPHARQIARLAARDGLTRAVPPEQALPVYLRDDVAVPSPVPG